jgi:tetratricopeptide (TPR) repeat protein
MNSSGRVWIAGKIDHLHPRFVVVLLLLVLSCFSLGETATDNRSNDKKETPQTVTLRAVQLAQAGDIDDAVRLLRTFLLTHPSWLDARLVLAGIYARAAQPREAEEQYREAVRFHASSTDAKFALAEFYNASGKLTEAEQVLQVAIHSAPKFVSAHQLLALVQAREHKYQEAKQNLAAVPVPSETPARIKYLRLSASIESGLGDAPIAAHAMEEVLRLARGDHEVQLATAVAEAQAQKWSACLQNVRPLFVERPNATSGLLLLQAELGAGQDFHPTLEDIDRLKLADSEKLALLSRSAQLLADSGKHVEAVEELQQATAISGSGADLLYDLAVEQYRSGQLDAALTNVGQLQRSADSAELEDLSGDIQEERKDYLAAVHAYQTAVALAPDQEHYRLALGGELLRHENYEPATLVFQQAARLFPKSAQMLIGLGMTQFFQQLYDDSVSSFLRAVDLGDTRSDAIEYLGMTQLRAVHGPKPDVVKKVCSYADEHSNEGSALVWCGALMFRWAFMAGDESTMPEVIQRLRVATRAAPQSAAATCALGNALAWKEDWPASRIWLESCVRLDPDSLEDHYHLRRVYLQLGRNDLAKQQADLTVKAHTEQDVRESLSKKFSYQIMSQP